MANLKETVKEKEKSGLKFGTAGIRGLMGEGADRLNIHTVAYATEGVALYMKNAGLKHRVIIGYDTRRNSREFAEVTASVLKRAGIEVICFEKYLPVPLLAFGTRLFGCGIGIMITASHNPKDYNGYKIYDRFGCQLGDKEAEKVMKCIEKRSFESFLKDEEKAAEAEKTSRAGRPEAGGFGEADSAEPDMAGVMDGLYKYLTRVYIRTIKTQCTDFTGVSKEAFSQLKAAYTPLNGTGISFVREALLEAGVREENLYIVKEQENPDGEFPTCPYPNPEKTEALKLGLELAGRKDTDLLIATDPDADRLGVAVRDEDGAFSRLTGNEVALLMFDFICRRHREAGTMPKYPVALRTIVSSPLMDRIAQKYGVSVKTTLTGFKHIGALMADIRPNE